MTDRAAIIAEIKATIATAGADDTDSADISPADVNTKAPDAAPVTIPDTASGAPPAVSQAKLMIRWLRQLGFHPYLDDHGVLLIADATGRGRDVSRRLPIAKVFNDLTAGLDEDPGLLDRDPDERDRK